MTARRRSRRDPAALVARTRLSIDGARFRINGSITYPSQTAEGRLMNVRMVNSVFEDPGRPSFDPSANTDELVGADAGVRRRWACAPSPSRSRVGIPGTRGPGIPLSWRTARLKSGYLARVARVIERADALGAVVVLSLFYQRQDQRLDGRAGDSRRRRQRGRLDPAEGLSQRHAGGRQRVRAQRIRPCGPPLGRGRGQPSPPGQEPLPRTAGVGELPSERADHLTGRRGLRPASWCTSTRSRCRTFPRGCGRFGTPSRASRSSATRTHGPARRRRPRRARAVESGASYGLMVEDQNQYYPFYFSRPQRRSAPPTTAMSR